MANSRPIARHIATASYSQYRHDCDGTAIVARLLGTLLHKCRNAKLNTSSQMPYRTRVNICQSEHQCTRASHASRADNRLLQSQVETPNLGSRMSRRAHVAHNPRNLAHNTLLPDCTATKGSTMTLQATLRVQTSTPPDCTANSCIIAQQCNIRTKVAYVHSVQLHVYTAVKVHGCTADNLSSCT